MVGIGDYACHHAQDRVGVDLQVAVQGSDLLLSHRDQGVVLLVHVKKFDHPFGQQVVKGQFISAELLCHGLGEEDAAVVEDQKRTD